MGRWGEGIFLFFSGVQGLPAGDGCGCMRNLTANRKSKICSPTRFSRLFVRLRLALRLGLSALACS